MEPKDNGALAGKLAYIKLYMLPIRHVCCMIPAVEINRYFVLFNPIGRGFINRFSPDNNRIIAIDTGRHCIAAIHVRSNEGSRINVYTGSYRCSEGVIEFASNEFLRLLRNEIVIKR